MDEDTNASQGAAAAAGPSHGLYDYAADRAMRLIEVYARAMPVGFQSPEDFMRAYQVIYAGVGAQPVAIAKLEPIVDKPSAAEIRKSITPDHLISFEDGKPYKMLKRHVGKLGMTFDQYRAKWGLPADYPSVAASYSARRSELAKENGLGLER